MLRLHGQYVPAKTILLAVSETMLVVVSVWLAALIRLGNADGFQWYMAQPFAYLRLGMVTVVCVASFYYNDLYDLHVVHKASELIIRVLESVGVASVLLAALYILMPKVVVGRGITAIAALIIVFTVLLWRYIIGASDFFRPVERLLIVGTGTPGIRLLDELEHHKELRFHVVGMLVEEGRHQEQVLETPVIGSINDVDKIVEQERVDRVILSMGERRGAMPLNQLLRVKFSGRRIEDAHSLFEKLAGRIMLERLSPSALILSTGFRRGLLVRTFKRLTDVIISLVALVVFAPALAVVAVAILIESGRPIMFRQRRIGLYGEPFWMLKFRSMRTDPAKAGAVWATKTDPRITKVGAFIRRCRLDEVPQFINVLRGDMSVVGPRPEQPEFVEELSKAIPYYAERHTVRPGITGWAQIRYPYGACEEDAKNKLEFDLFYAKHLSTFFDLLIVIRTVQVMLFGKGAV